MLWREKQRRWVPSMLERVKKKSNGKGLAFYTHAYIKKRALDD